VIGPHALLIAATALAQGHALVTLNQRESGRVPGLRLVAVEGYLS
jgi:predicted nucleic acid-binding protein